MPAAIPRIFATRCTRPRWSKCRYKGNSLKNSNGVTIYFPTKDLLPLYPGLAFTKKTGWDGFLKAYLRTIRSR